jgi:hypothetical protein
MGGLYALTLQPLLKSISESTFTVLGIRCSFSNELSVISRHLMTATELGFDEDTVPAARPRFLAIEELREKSGQDWHVRNGVM